MKADIVEHLLRAMEQRNLNGSQLAENLGKSRQWVSRILNETDNFTVDTIAKLACAVGKRPFINLIDHGEMIRIMPFKTEWEAIYNHEMRDHVSSSFVFQAAESGEVFCSSHFENLPSHENSEESLDNFDELSRAA
jgi:transcriptional regulator with XRE-family HTH domain